jgi:hypothetical protein
VVDESRPQLPTLEEAQAKLAEIQNWLRDFEARAQQAPTAREQSAFLNGIIAALSPDEPDEG